MEAIENYKGIDSTVGRIDHNKDYSIGNIRIENRADNSRERQRRAGPSIPKRPVEVTNLITGEKIIVSCKNDAIKLTGIPRNTVLRQCYEPGKLHRQKYQFRFSGVSS